MTYTVARKLGWRERLAVLFGRQVRAEVMEDDALLHMRIVVGVLSMPDEEWVTLIRGEGS